MARRLSFALLLVCLLPFCLSAREKRFGYCQTQNAGVRVTGCTVTVYVTGTLTLATLYQDNSGTLMGNPFTASPTSGLWQFYSDNGRYDVQFSGGSPTISPAYTLSDLLFLDLGQQTLIAGTFQSASTNIAHSGVLQLAAIDQICWRNNANTADLCVAINGSDLLTFNGTALPELGLAQTWSLLQTFLTVPAFPSQAANQFFASSCTVPSIPAFRSICAADIPPVSLTSSGNGGVSSAGTTSGHIATWTAGGQLQDGGPPSGGGISSIALTLPPQFTVTGSPCVSSTCAFAGSLQPEPSNYVWAGPALNSIGGVFDGTAGGTGNSAAPSLVDTPTTAHDWAFVAVQSSGQSAAPTMPAGWTKNFSPGNNGAVWNQVFNTTAAITAPITLANSAQWAEILFMLRLPGGGPTIVQSQSTTGAFTTSTNTFVSNTTTGNSIIAIFCGVPAVTMQATFTDNQKNIYTLVGVASNGLNAVCIAGMTSTILGGTTDPVTVTLNGLSTGSFFLTMEVTNIAAPTGEPTFRALQPGDFPANISGPPVNVFSAVSLANGGIGVGTTSGGDVAVAATTPTTIATRVVTMPSVGCPCRAFAGYSLYVLTASSGVGYSSWVSDGTNTFAGDNEGQSNGSSGALVTLRPGMPWSLGTYANGAVITFNLITEGDHTYIVKGSSQLAGSAPNSGFEVAISTSN